MIVEPKVKGFICTTAHPEGCRESVRRQIEYVKSKGKIAGPKNVLVIGASTGYGLASRITMAFGAGAATLGVMFERESNGKKTATPGFYNTRAFEKYAGEEGLYAKTINGDAFSREIKNQVIETIKADMGKVDLVVYSLAAPRRTMEDGTVYQSVLKTTGEPFTNKNWNLGTNTLCEATIEPATKEETEATVKVMGGEDWMDWIKSLKDADAISDGAITIAYSYIGPVITYPIYYKGTIGMAKKHLLESSKKINEKYKSSDIKAYVSVNKALVTQASSAIPIVPLYFSILYRVMKDMGIHEGCIEQMNRLFKDKLYTDKVELDREGQIRMDDWEMRSDVQEKVKEIWDSVNDDTFKEVADIDGYWEDFYHMFGFKYDNVDYTVDVDIM